MSKQMSSCVTIVSDVVPEHASQHGGRIRAHFGGSEHSGLLQECQGCQATCHWHQYPTFIKNEGAVSRSGSKTW